EPSSSMDLASERQLIRHLSQSFDRNTTIIISTHRFSMLELVDRLIVIEQGRVIADGPKAQVLQALSKSGVEAAVGRTAQPEALTSIGAISSILAAVPSPAFALGTNNKILAFNAAF